MNDLNYPFRTKQEADKFRKEVERKTGEKYITKKIVFTTQIYQISAVKTRNKSGKKMTDEKR